MKSVGKGPPYKDRREGNSADGVYQELKGMLTLKKQTKALGRGLCSLAKLSN